MLIRNYDYSAHLWEATLLHNAWNGRQVIAMSDCLWGVLDGMNENGLAISLAFGGRQIVGNGFGIPLILRYILEICETVSQSIEVLGRVPSHMSYNVTMLDKSGCARDGLRRTRSRPGCLATTRGQPTIRIPSNGLSTKARPQVSIEPTCCLSDCATRTKPATSSFRIFSIRRFSKKIMTSKQCIITVGERCTRRRMSLRSRVTCRWPGICLKHDFSGIVEQELELRFS